MTSRGVGATSSTIQDTVKGELTRGARYMGTGTMLWAGKTLSAEEQLIPLLLHRPA